MKQALFFVTHIFDSRIEKRLKKIILDTDGLCDVYIATNQPDVIPSEYQARVRTWSIEEMQERNKYLISAGYLWNCHMTPLIVRDKVSWYKYFWFVEYDVVYTGNWKDIIQICMPDNADLIATHLREYREDNQWQWWNTLQTRDDILTDTQKIKGFFAVYRISQRWIQAIEQSIQRGWSGHFESLIPTAIRFQNGILHELWWNTKLTPLKRKWCFYTLPSSQKLIKIVCEFRYRPYHVFCLKKNTLYHPVKTSLSGGFTWEFWMSGALKNSKDISLFQKIVLVWQTLLYNSFTIFSSWVSYICVEILYKNLCIILVKIKNR